MNNAMLEIKESVYGLVIAGIDLVPGDKELEVRIREALDELLPRVVTSSIWKNMSDVEAKAFEDYAAQIASISPTMPQEEILCSFSSRYQSLSDKVSNDVAIFIEDFVAALNSA